MYIYIYIHIYIYIIYIYLLYVSEWEYSIDNPCPLYIIATDNHLERHLEKNTCAARDVLSESVGKLFLLTF